jgi:hypothetical protein
MAWPFASAAAPTLNTGPGTAVPTSPGTVTSSACWLMGAHFTNTDGSSSRTVTITDAAGAIVAEVPIPAGGEQPYEWFFRPVTGLKWFADGGNVVGHLWGYQ